MSEEQLKAFWEAVQADTYLQEKLRAATDADSIASIAKEAGFEITADEVKEAQSELSEDQLRGVAGGLCEWSDCITGCEQGGIGPCEGEEYGGTLTHSKPLH